MLYFHWPWFSGCIPYCVSFPAHMRRHRHFVAQYVISKDFHKCFLMSLQQAFKYNDHSLNTTNRHINDEQSEDNGKRFLDNRCNLHSGFNLVAASLAQFGFWRCKRTRSNLLAKKKRMCRLEWPYCERYIASYRISVSWWWIQKRTILLHRNLNDPNEATSPELSQKYVERSWRKYLWGSWLCPAHESLVKFDWTLTQMSRVRVESSVEIKDMSRVRVESHWLSSESKLSQLDTAWVKVNLRLTGVSAERHWPGGGRITPPPQANFQTDDRSETGEATLERSRRDGSKALLKLFLKGHMSGQGQVKGQNWAFPHFGSQNRQLDSNRPKLGRNTQRLDEGIVWV